MSDGSNDLLSRLQQLQSRFTWDLQGKDLDLENLSTRLQEHIDLQLGSSSALARTFSFLAYVRYLQGQPEMGLPLLSQAEQKIRECHGGESERRLIVAYGDLAWFKYHTGDQTEAHAYCQKVQDILSKHPTGSPAVLHPEVYGEKAWTYFKFSRSYYPEAIDLFLKALELQPDDSEWNAGYAIALYRTEERVTETPENVEDSPVVRQLRRALEINPDDGVLLTILALKQKACGNHQEAEGLVERALKIAPDNPHVMRYIGKYLRIQGENDRSIDLLKRALKKSPSAFIHHQLGMSYKKMKISEQMCRPSNRQKVQEWRRQSIHHLEEALKMKPLFFLALADLALMVGEERDFSRAEELFKHGLEMLPKLSEKSLCQVFYQRYGDFHFYHTISEAHAITNYIQVVQMTPNTWEWKQGAKNLKKIAERRLKEDEDDGQAYALLAQVAKAEGHKKKAEDLYEKALDCDKNNTEYLSALCELRLELQ
ncbi:interferon-induced protein with tetratricopeptide repeats 5-like [Cololabis saira]|uniref:interferon-induced protein with tetratricopeptide repeats 5-like n=1 Tax=Cololabis saira TaxID=129043 RepID=UPI002AD377CD|nr:interferon-induced protein with tetratricopeptide repeats 5-like [Cololabis saira]